MRKRVVFLVGASGVGKTSVAEVLATRPPWAGRTHFFDSLGVPTPGEMVQEKGSLEGWQEWRTREWVRRLANPEMDKWAAYLSGQADALGLPVIDTSGIGLDEVADRVEEVGLEGYRFRRTD